MMSSTRVSMSVCVWGALLLSAPAALAGDCPSVCDMPLLGDMNGDGELTVSDPIGVAYAANNPDVEVCMSVADVDRNGVLDLEDALYLSNIVFGNERYPELPKLQGDVNADGVFDIADFAAMADSLTEPDKDAFCGDRADVNGDCRFDVADVMYFSDYLWTGGPSPIQGECTP